MLSKIFNSYDQHLLSFIKGIVCVIPLLWIIYIPKNKNNFQLLSPEITKEIVLFVSFAELIQLMNRLHFNLIDKKGNYYFFDTRTFMVDRGKILVEFQEEQDSYKIQGYPATIKQISSLVRIYPN